MSDTISTQIVNILKGAGVKRIYGIPGDTIDTLMESIRIDKEMDFVLTRHEANAGFMASGEARMSNSLAVTVACQGPGANNMLNGLADAAGDGVPVLAITGQIETDYIGTGMPQGGNQLQLFDEICLFNAEARSPHNLIELLHIAINAALQGGVAHISVPSDIMKHDAIPYKSVSFVEKSRISPNMQAVEAAAEAINKANSVAILYGEGSREASDLVVALAEKIGAPLIHTTRSKDIIDNSHPNIVGGIGLMGSHPANQALHACELLIVVGSNFAYSHLYPDIPIVKIDRLAKHLASHISVDYPILSDAGPALEGLMKFVHEKKSNPYLNSLSKYMRKHLDDFLYRDTETASQAKIHPGAVVQEVMKCLGDDGILCGDSGTSTIWINNAAQFKPGQRFIWSANLATLGAALGQAIGANLVTKRPVVVIAGDGGFQFSINDLVTAAMYNVPVKCFILNNSTLKFIEFEERAHDGNVPSGVKLLNPDYAALADASHCKGMKADTYEELINAAKMAFMHDGPVVVDCRIDPDITLLPPAVSPKMALNYLKSEFKSWFTTTSEEEKRIDELSKQTKI
jgi:thiamine pyrophosphate-dependent acetolactate synthase large subunit-like protein